MGCLTRAGQLSSPDARLPMLRGGWMIVRFSNLPRNSRTFAPDWRPFSIAGPRFINQMFVDHRSSSINVKVVVLIEDADRGGHDFAPQHIQRSRYPGADDSCDAARRPIECQSRRCAVYGHAAAGVVGWDEICFSTKRASGLFGALAGELLLPLSSSPSQTPLVAEAASQLRHYLERSTAPKIERRAH